MRARPNDDPGEAVEDLKDDLKGFAEADLATLLAQLAAIRKDITGIAAAIGSVGLGRVESMTETMRGAFDHATAGLKGEAGEARRRGEEAAEEVEAMIVRNPLVSLLLALGLGFLAGMLTRR